MGCNHLAILRGSIVENPLDKIVAVLVTGDVDERDPGPVRTAFAYAIEVAAEKISPSYLEALLDDLGGKLIRAVLSCVPNDMVDGPASVGRRTVLANVLDAPVPKLPMRYDVDICKHLFNTWSLWLSLEHPVLLEEKQATHLILLQAILKNVLDN